MSEVPAEWSPEQVRPGQVRRDPKTGNHVTVKSVEADDVHGTYASPVTPATTGLSAWPLRDFAGFPLISDPEARVWRVSGELPWGDAEVRVYEDIGTVVSHRSPALTAEGPKQLTTVDVVAIDAERARHRLAEVAKRANANIDPESLSAEAVSP